VDLHRKRGGKVRVGAGASLEISGIAMAGADGSALLISNKGLLHTLRRIHLLDEFTAARRAARARDALKQYFVFTKICINIVTEILGR
jgi:hypothetical protein